MTRHLFDAFRTGLPGCEIVALTDISTGTVLAWSAALKWPQDDVDALCALAGRMLDLGSDTRTGAPTPHAVIAQPTGTYVIVRAAPDRPEALCCILAPGAAMDTVIATMMRFCADLARGAASETGAT